jgi:hypothetical protein
MYRRKAVALLIAAVLPFVFLSSTGCRMFDAAPKASEEIVNQTKAALLQILSQYKPAQTDVDLRAEVENPEYTATGIAGVVYLVQLEIQAEGVEAGVGVGSVGVGSSAIPDDVRAEIVDILNASDKNDQWRLEKILGLIRGGGSPVPAGDAEGDQ